MSLIHERLSSLEKVEQTLAIKKAILIEKAFKSTHPSDIIKANSILSNINTKDVGNDPKSYLIDPYQFNSMLGYKDKPYSLTYNMLRKISFSVPIIRAVINTRIDQIASFCEPQKDKYSIGFVIRKKQNYFNNSEQVKLTKEDMQNIENITEFILNCGVDSESFSNDDFDTFVRKSMNDSYTFDQMTFEVVRNRFGKPHSFLAVDAATIRIAESYDDNFFDNGHERVYNLDRKKIKGYYPSHVQIKDSAAVTDYYPWELCFGIRNPTTNIYSNGYGISEQEILINTITSMLWSDEYNRRFFSQGSAPKGLLKIKSGTNINNTTLSQFRQQWQSMMAGVSNSWKTPILEGDIDWVDLQKSNNDMEFSSWQEYLIKLTCAVFCIDPAEINFPLSGGAEQKAMFEGNNEARLKHSKDKGLYPQLKFLQRKINKYIVKQLDPRYEFVFCGMDVDNPSDELEGDIKMMSNFMTVNEIRTKRGLKPLSEEQGGNTIANSVLLQAANQRMMQEQMEQQNQAMYGGNEEQNAENPYPEGEYEETADQNPITKAFESYLTSLN